MAHNNFHLVFIILSSTCMVQVDSIKSLYKGIVAADISPYIYWDKKAGKVAGIFPEITKMIEFYCHLPNNSKFIEYHVIQKEPVDVHDLFLSSVTYGQGALKNISDNESLWFPYFTNVENHDLKRFRERKVTYVTLLEAKKLVVIMETWRSSIGYRVLLGIFNSRVLMALSLCISIIVAFVTWLVERKEQQEINENFYRGLGNSLWLATVTMFTVGYGDIAPIRAFTKLLMIFWMVFGLFISSLVMAIVLESITNSDSLTLNGKKVAVMNSTYEQEFVKQNYNAKSYIYTRNNEDAVEKVRTGEADVTVINADVASWHQELIIRNEKNKGDAKLSFVYTIDVNFPIPFIVSTDNNYTNEILKCIKDHHQEIVKYSEEKYKRYLHIDSIKTETLYTAANMPGYQAVFGITFICFLAGIVIEHHRSLCGIFKNNRKQSTDLNTYKNRNTKQNKIHNNELQTTEFMDNEKT